MREHPERADPRSGPLTIRPAIKLIASLLALTLLGTALFLIPGMTTRSFGVSEAAFTAVSALTVTGLTVITPVQDLTAAGKIGLLVLIQIGGVGYMVLAVTAFRLIGRHISLTDRLALKDALGVLNPGGVLKLAGQVLKTVLLIEAVGAVLLWLHWRQIMPETRAIFYGVFHSISAFCNAGFDLFSGHPEHFEGLPQDNISLIIMGTLVFLGVLGIPVLFDLISFPRQRTFTLHTKLTVPLVLTLVFAGAIAFYLSEGIGRGVLRDVEPDRAAVMSIFQSISARSGGFHGVPNFDQIEPAAELVMLSLMFIGGAPASMGGGITTGTFAVLILALWAYARGRSTPVFKGRAIPGEMVRKGAAVLTISVVVIALATWLLALTHPNPLIECGFEVTSAFATCGLTLGMTPDLNLFGRILLMIMMFWGRLGALTIFIILAGTSDRRRVTYPEEKILIG
jgi:trk system potassium uptake protein